MKDSEIKKLKYEYVNGYMFGDKTFNQVAEMFEMSLAQCIAITSKMLDDEILKLKKK